MRRGKRGLLFAGIFILSGSILFLSSFKNSDNPYYRSYFSRLDMVKSNFEELRRIAIEADFSDAADKDKITHQIYKCRESLKAVDVWLRYFDPTIYKLLNGPLPVEWETEVFEKYEKPYRRPGSGLILAQIYLDECGSQKDSFVNLIQRSLSAIRCFKEDSITQNLKESGTFHLANRLHLLNLAAIYTTGFECPDRSRILPELLSMIKSMLEEYEIFNASFEIKFTDSYLALYREMVDYVQKNSAEIDRFDHFTFIRDYVNPLFGLQVEIILSNKILSKSFVDYSLNNGASYIFENDLYIAQNTAGIYAGIKDKKVLDEIMEMGRLLFYDPILSGNLSRSCASCHKPDQCFADTAQRTSIAFDNKSRLSRNTPSLIYADKNHLLMYDGAHFTLRDQALGVITNAVEMNGDQKMVMKNILTCPDYRIRLKNLAKFTPLYPKPGIEHITSALSLYYSSFSQKMGGFDSAMNKMTAISSSTQTGFNLFMGKAQCATCHFVPQFNGVKPPYTGSEFEVIGTPEDPEFSNLSPDSGRYRQHPADEMYKAFRTPGLKNVNKTAPYMHNGVFKTLQEVISFYNHGGGVGNGMNVSNQTLSADSLHLSEAEISAIVAFLKSLDDAMNPAVPHSLPMSRNKDLNLRKPSGIY